MGQRGEAGLIRSLPFLGKNNTTITVNPTIIFVAIVLWLDYLRNLICKGAPSFRNSLIGYQDISRDRMSEEISELQSANI